jgi:hypothetical protein
MIRATKYAHVFPQQRPLCLVLSIIEADMPLVKIFARNALSKPVPLAAIQSKLCNIWGTKPNTTKLILQRVEDWTDESFHEDVYVDIRAYGKFQLRAALKCFTLGLTYSTTKYRQRRKNTRNGSGWNEESSRGFRRVRFDCEYSTGDI